MIGERIKRLRLQKGISLTELAEKAGVAKSYISSIERNLQKNPSIQFLEKIAAVLQIPVDTLLHDETTKETNLDSEWTQLVKDAKGDNAGEDFGKHVKVKFLWNWDKQSEPVYETTLADLQKVDPDLLAKDIFAPEWGEKGGLAAGTEDYLWVQFEFVDDGKDQNIFQGDTLNLEWTFNANQEAGEEK
ncbi:helix-turn-helix domain-containing protein [Bacillus thuringiensis]|nr:helix-turn-helix domain-containing protein [Bacillus thuringiensis]